jgi:hypothetical protein
MSDGYWAMRTDRHHRELLGEELSRGRLRQGWAWDDRLDLRRLKARADSGNLGDDTDVWRRTWRLLVGEAGAFQVGDLVVTPNLPVNGRWSIVRVVGDYFFERLPGGDHGHVVPVEVIQREVSPRHPAVSADMRNSFKYRGRLWSLGAYVESVEELAKASDPGEESTELARLEHIHEGVVEAAFNRIVDRFGDADFERPMARLLEALFGVPVEETGGRNERGADLLCRYQDALGTDHAVVVQVKRYTGTADEGRLIHALDQIERAYGSYEGVTSGVVLTLLDSVQESVIEDAERRSRNLMIPVRVLTRHDVVPLFVDHLDELIGGPQAPT